MNRPNQIQKAKSLAQKFNPKNKPEQGGYEEEEDKDEYKKPFVPQNRGSSTLFDKINKMFDDPSIKNLKDVDHDDFLNKDNDDEGDNIPSTSTKPKASQAGKDVLDKAKQLLEKKQGELPAAKEKYKKKASLIQKANENTFVTGLGLYQDQKEEPKESVYEPQDKGDENDDDDEEYVEIDQDEYLKNLQTDDLDDLAELRKMIAATKKEIQGYAGEVYSLKNSINDLNVGYKDIGYQFDEDRFSDIDRDFNRFMPGGETHKLVDNLAYKSKSSQSNITAQGRKGFKKNSLIESSLIQSSVPSASQGALRKPVAVKQPVLDKLYGANKPGELQSISGTTKQIGKTVL